MNGGGDTAHRLAKPHSIEALTWHGAYIHASVLAFGHEFTKLHLIRHHRCTGPHWLVSLIAKIILKTKVCQRRSKTRL